MNRTELRSFSYFQILMKITYRALRRNPENWLILKFVFIQCKTVKLNQNDQIQLQTWFPHVYLINRTDLRSFSHFQIFPEITYPGFSRNLENWLILKFVFIHCKTVKVSQSDLVQLWTCFPHVFLMNWTELRSFSHFEILAEITYLDLSRKLENWLMLKFVFIHCKTDKVNQNEKIQLLTWFPPISSMNGTQLRSFCYFKSWPKPHTGTLGEILKID